MPHKQEDDAVASPGVRGWGAKLRESGGRKSPSVVQGRSPGEGLGLGAKPPEAENKT